MIGATVGNYQVREEIGHGGMGVVYAAEHPLIGRKVAVKVLLPEYSRNQEVVNRFFNEARATTLIRHPGLVDVIDFGYYDDGSAYIIMEFLEGESLASRLKRGPLAVKELVGIGKQVAAAVGAAHEKGIVHRDLKPDNIFLVPDRELAGGVRVKVLDFGIAKLTAHEKPGPNTPGGSMKTRTGVVMGTPLYMSPEQGGGASAVDARADIYSLGCILYEMATGRVPFVKEGFGEVIAAHIYEQPLAPRELVPELTRALEKTILHALAKKPDERPQTMAALAAELEAAANAAADAGDDDALDDELPRPSRTPLYVVGGAVALAAVVGVIALAARPGKSDKKAPPAAMVAAPATKPAQTSSVTPPKPVEAKKVTRTIVSTPPGAEVFRADDGALLGITPFRDVAAPSAGKVGFVLRLAGHDDGRAELAGDRDDSVTVALHAHVSHSAHAKAADKPPASKRTRVRDGAVDPF